MPGSLDGFDGDGHAAVRLCPENFAPVRRHLEVGCAAVRDWHHLDLRFGVVLDLDHRLHLVGPCSGGCFYRVDGVASRNHLDVVFLFCLQNQNLCLVLRTWSKGCPLLIFVPKPAERPIPNPNQALVLRQVCSCSK